MPRLTITDWSAYRFPRRQVIWYSHILKNFPQFVVIHTVKDFCIVNEAGKIIVVFFFFFWNCLYFSMIHWLLTIWSGSSAFSKSSLYFWKFSDRLLLNSSLKDFEQSLACIWIEHNSEAVWTFFVIALLWDWNGSWPSPVLWPLPSFQKLLAHCLQPFNSIIFWDFKEPSLNSVTSTSVVHITLPKAHLTSHPRMLGSGLTD